MNSGDIQWSKTMFNSLADGGMWGVPRSGLIFQRQGSELVLVDRLPHIVEMPLSRDELEAQQQSEFEGICQHFNAAGIVVRDSSRNRT